MHEWKSLSHVRWECKYHVVIIPKYRRRVLYGDLRRRVGRILRELCEQRGVELIEGNAQPDHIPPVYEHPSQVQRISHDRFSEREECGTASTENC